MDKELSLQSKEGLERDLQEVNAAIKAAESKLKEWRGTYGKLKKERDELHRRKEAIKFLLEEFKDEKPASKKLR